MLLWSRRYECLGSLESASGVLATRFGIYNDVQLNHLSIRLIFTELDENKYFDRRK